MTNDQIGDNKSDSDRDRDSNVATRVAVIPSPMPVLTSDLRRHESEWVRVAVIGIVIVLARNKQKRVGVLCGHFL